jgi:uncharacterized protein (DUF433 family)
VALGGRLVPIDFLQTVLNIRGGNISRATADDLWAAAQLYAAYERKAASQRHGRNISRAQDVTLLYAATYLRRHPQLTGQIVVDGKTIPVLYIAFQLRLRGKNISDVTVQQLRTVARDYNVPVIRIPLAPRPTATQISTLRVIAAFLKTQGPNATGSFTFSGYRIPTQFILRSLEQRGISTEDLSYGQLWTFIRAYVAEIEELDKLPAQERTALQDILNYLKILGDSATGEITFRGHRISVDFIETALLLRGEDASAPTLEDLWAALQLYEVYERKLETEPHGLNFSRHEAATLLYVATYLRSHPDVAGEVVVDGVQVPVSYILGQLSIRGIDIRTLTLEQIRAIISAYISQHKPPEPAPLGKHPTAEETFELRVIAAFLKTQGPNATGSFAFRGYRIPTQFILTYLEQHGISISNLTYEQLWTIVLLYVDNETTTTTSEVSSGSPGPTGTGEGSGTGSGGTTGTGEGSGTGSGGTTETGEGSGTGSGGTTGTGEGSGTGSGGTTGTGEGSGTGSGGTTGTGEGGNSFPSGTVPAGASLNETLYTILEELLTEGLNATGYIDFRGRIIPLQFILTALGLKHVDVRNATAAEIYDVLLSYVHYAESTRPHEQGVPEDDIVSLLVILQYLRTTEADEGNFTFDGYEISKQFIAEVIKAQNVSFDNLTLSELYLILEIYIGFEGNSTALIRKPPVEVIASLEAVVEILQTRGDNATGAVDINGYVITFEYIDRILKALGIDARAVSSEQLWLILELAVEFQKRSGGPEAILKFLTETLSDSESVDGSVLVVDGESVAVSEIASALGLQVDNSTGQYDTRNLTAGEAFRALLEIVGKQRASTGSPQAVYGKEQLLRIFLGVLSNPDRVANTVIEYNGQQIGVQALVQALGLHVDSATGAYDADGLTADQLYEKIQQFVSTTPKATT